MIEIFINMFVWFVVITPLIFFVIVIVINIQYKKKQSKLKQERNYENFDTFVKFFFQEKIKHQVCFEVYHYLQQLSSVKNFPVKPSDILSEIYGVGVPFGIYLDEVIDELSLQCWKRRFLDVKKIPKELNTVEDLIKFVSALGEEAPEQNYRTGN
jgi:hypothetical protein